MNTQSQNNEQITNYSIYIIYNLVNGKMYVGATKNPYKRWKDHKKIAKLNSSNKYAIHLAIRKYGPENFIFKIIEENLTFKEAMNKEILWIEELRNLKYKLYNETNGGEGCSGRIVSEETKEKISKKNKGKNNYFYGKKLYGKLNGNFGRKMKPHIKEILLKYRRKLNEQQVNEIRELYKLGEYSQTKLSKIFNISLAQINRIVRLKRWNIVLP